MSKLVSVVIPCRNEEKYIERCVDSILNQGHPHIEVLVVDGFSDDNTRVVLNKYDSDKRVVLIDNPERVTPIALNRGITASNGEIVIIFGAHAEMLPNYVRRCVETFDIDTEIGCVGGILNQLHENQKAFMISQAMSSPFGVGNAHFRTGYKSGYVDTVAFGAYRKLVFDKIGLFDDSLVRNQDDDFNYRVIQAGFKIYLNPDIESNYFVRSSFEKLFKQYFQYGYWKVLVNKKHKTVTSFRQVVPGLFVAFILFGALASSFSFWIRSFYFFVLGLYLFSAMYAANLKAKILKDKLGVSWSFLLLHFGYGLGYWKGILDFFVLKKNAVRDSQKKLTR